MNLLDMIPKDKQEEALSLIKKLQHQDVKTFEPQRISKDGKRLNVSLTVGWLVDNDGKPVAIATTELDITGGKQQN